MLCTLYQHDISENFIPEEGSLHVNDMHLYKFLFLKIDIGQGWEGDK